LKHFEAVAKKYHVVLPISFFEKAGNCFFNSLGVIDSDGTLLGIYRKSHIPTGECYEEKFYFTPGDTGFMVFDTAIGSLGVAICWDQWFPETARILALKGAELIVYPTAIGSEPVFRKTAKIIGGT
jgi:N-carbamoylputrescine amidase